MKKLIALLFAAVLAASMCLAFAGCSEKRYELPHYDGIGDMNKSLFFQNETGVWAADPTIIRTEDEQGKDLYYIYATSGEINSTGFCAWKSYNLTDWIEVGPVFMPKTDESWSYKNFWAPGVIYEDGVYYLFYNATWGSTTSNMYMSVATSTDPEGPFTECTTDVKGIDEPLIIFEDHKDEIPAELRTDETGYLGTGGFIKAIDACPYKDPVSGKRYLYFCLDRTESRASQIYMMEFEDWLTPKYETLKQLTAYGYTTVGGSEKIAEGSNVNEGPDMYYRDGVYYLTFSTYAYTNENYQVRQAVSTSPEGPFVKVAIEDGGQVMYTESNFQRQSAGHHGFIEIDGELYAAYHTFRNNLDYSEGRKIAFDRVSLVRNAKGQRVLQMNGPTVTPQPLPESISGYKNVAPLATVTSDNTREGSDVAFLTDGVIPMHIDSALVEEYRAGTGETEITFVFSDDVILRAVVVYNSALYDEAFNNIKDIEIKFSQGKASGIASTGTVNYNWEKFYDDFTGSIAIGSAAFAEFDELQAKSVTIRIVNPGNAEGVSIPEIVLLGRDA